ncbi:LysM peptidoglycan-binding domain-containing protein [Pontibacter arcticus]|nr:LysM peptidoglycan-binding domain-containing protein [Pontibacter arcticus]
MIRVLVTALLVAPFLTFTAMAAGFTALPDSVGIERKNGKVFVQHKVEPKETLYALSRKYNVPVAKIVESNPSVQNSINVGQIVLIPRKTPAASPATTAAKTPAANTTVATASNRTFTVNDNGDKLHTVAAKQTLFSLSKMYNVSVDDIKRWNNITDNSINVGASIIVGKGASKPTKNPVYVPESDEEMTKPKTVEPLATPVKSEPARTEPAATTSERVENSEADESGVKKTIETGMAESIDPKADSNKYLALHRTAPVGTIMQVKNLNNGQVVYVRVIGKLQDSNNDLIVRVSKKAYQKLNASDARFKVEVSYMP